MFCSRVLRLANKYWGRLSLSSRGLMVDLLRNVCLLPVSTLVQEPALMSVCFFRLGPRFVQALAGYLMFGTVSGIMMALFLDNVGGAWDNAKKYIEVTDWKLQYFCVPKSGIRASVVRPVDM